MRAPLALLVVLLGCSSGGSGAPGGASFDYCAAKTDRANRCETGVVDTSKCQQEATCYQNAFRAEDRDTIMRCFATRACSTSDDPCVNDPARKYSSDPTVTAWIDACNSKRAGCSNSFTDDFCTVMFGVLTDSVRASLKACLDKPCSEVGGCWDAALTAIGCD